MYDKQSQKEGNGKHCTVYRLNVFRCHCIRCIQWMQRHESYKTNQL